MSYLAILGRQPELGLVELESRLGADHIKSFGEHALVTRTLPMEGLGGTVKLARVIADTPLRSLDKLDIDPKILPIKPGKNNFGLSVYGIAATPRSVGALGLALKKRLRAQGSFRLITPTDSTALSAAQLKFNKVLESGFELIIAVAQGRAILALTEQIQDIDWYSRRDYERPARDPKIGMLPPKLAQILVNTTPSDASVFDPFVGTGVVLQEALLLDRPSTGSDLEPNMVKATQTNLHWLQDQVKRQLPPWEVTATDARQAKLPPPPVAVVSEGYLGANYGTPPTTDQITKTRAEITKLYTEWLSHLLPQLPTSTHLAICAPVWQTGGQIYLTDILDRAIKLGYSLKQFQTVDSARLVYRRPDQAVGRQLLLLTKL